MRTKNLQDESVALLRELLRIDTSNPPGRETPAAALLERYLRANGVECELVAREPGRANLVARLPGRRSDHPSLMLLGHTDVVPADASRWRHPPFSGFLDADGYVWGRGALDMKNEVVTRAVAMAALARSGDRLAGDLVFVAAADEEDGSDQVGLRWLVEERPDLATDFVLNEGAAERLVLADGRTVVTLSAGEKAAAGVRVIALGTPGHASMPYDIEHAVGVLADLIQRLTAYRPVRRTLPATARLLETLVGPGGAGEGLEAQIAQAKELHPALSGVIGPLFSTTIAPTRLQASDALNVLPARAAVECDCRLLPGASTEELLAEFADALGTDLPYELEVLDRPVGGSVSPLESPVVAACESFLAAHDPDAVLVPTIATGFTDSHWVRARFGSQAYGFWPTRATPHEVWSAGVHGHDERVHVQDLGYATLFHVYACRALLGLRGAPA